MHRDLCLATFLGLALVACGPSGREVDGGRQDAGVHDPDDASRGDAGVPEDATARSDGAPGTDAGAGAACPTPPPGGPTPGEHAAALRAAMCAAEERCGGALAPWIAPTTACHPGFAGDASSLEAWIAGGSVCFDAEAAAACIDAYSHVECSELARISLGVCRRALRGLLGEGAPCVSSEQCADGACRTGASCPGECAALPREGERCAAPFDCASGLICTRGTCLPPQAAGAACDFWLSCAAGLACIGGRCGAPLGEGERCMPFECAPDLYCYTSGAISVCRAREVAGRACDALEECAAGLTCATRMCVDASGPGEPCTRRGQCPAAYACDVTSGCVPLPRLGEACGAHGCWEGDCTGGVCVARGAGAPCSDDRDCVGWCDVDPVFGSECVDPVAEGASCRYRRECEAGLDCRAGACRASCGT